MAKQLCDRRFGIGADQLLTVHPSKVADFKMEIYNADGSQVEMCGNGIRCFAKYVYDHGITQKRELEVETLAGIIRPKIVGESGRSRHGRADSRRAKDSRRRRWRDQQSSADGATARLIEITCVSMGNPHLVIYLDDIDSLDLEKIGPDFEHHPFFPKRVNTEFIKIISPTEVRHAGVGARRRRDLGLRHRRQRRRRSRRSSPAGPSAKSRSTSRAAIW